MKTAISLPDSLFAQAEAVRRRLKKSRSEFYAAALAAYLGRFDPETVTQAMDRVCEEIEGHGDGWVPRAGADLLRDTEW